MAITTAMCTSFKQQVLEAGHDFTATGGDVFKLALYTSSVTLGASTTVYAATNEVGASGSYAASGGALTNNGASTSGTSGIVDFADLTFTSATITARGCLIYNSSKGNRAVGTFDFGSDKTSTNGNFTIVFPAAAAGTAVLELA